MLIVQTQDAHRGVELTRQLCQRTYLHLVELIDLRNVFMRPVSRAVYMEFDNTYYLRSKEGM